MRCKDIIIFMEKTMTMFIEIQNECVNYKKTMHAKVLVQKTLFDLLTCESIYHNHLSVKRTSQQQA